MTDRNTTFREDDLNDDLESAGVGDEEEKKEESFGKGFVMKVRNELEPFKYESYTPPATKRTTKPKQKLENGIEYEGEWDDAGKKDGRGVQVWADGSIYEGYWRNGMANGKGRLIHADGDIQDGDWVDDKAHGFGLYIHADGSKYEG